MFIFLNEQPLNAIFNKKGKKVTADRHKYFNSELLFRLEN